MYTTAKSTAASTTTTPHTWDAFVQGHPQAHLLQSSGWGTLKSRFGWRSEIVTLDAGSGGVSAGALMLYRRVAGLTMAYVPKGPLVNWADPALTAALIEKLQATCRQQGALFLKIEPDLPDTPANRTRLHAYGFRPSPQTIQPQSTILLDLAGDETALLGRMKSKWRYNIRLAERKEVTVRQVERSDLDGFNELMAITGVRDGFAVHSPAYYATAYETFVPGQAAFLLAEYAGQPLAALVVALCGSTAWYLWGASSDRERNRMPNHALQWAAMRWARERGATRYDFWGIPDAIGQVALGLRNGDGSGIPADALPLDLEALPAHDLWGVYRFKQGFGGAVVRWVGAWDLPLNPLGYRVYQIGLGVRERIKEIKEIRRPETRDFAASLQSPVSQSLVSTLQSLNFQEIHDAPGWRATLAALPDPHVLQSWEWGELKSQTEWHAERFVLCENNQPRAAFQFLWRELSPYLPLRVAYIPKGPVLDWADADLAEATLAQIERVARAKRCLFVKIDPDVREDVLVGQRLMHTLGRRGWRFSSEQIQIKNTGFTDLTDGEAGVLEGMKQKWRYNVRLAERRGIRIREGGLGDLATFYALYAETAQRDGFLIRPFEYYRTTWARFLAAQSEPANPAGGALLLAEHPAESQPVAGLFLFRYGARTWYFYGASSERQRRDMPNYLLQWAALRWAVAQGCTVYDWWGAPTDLNDSQDRMQGVWHFKQGFGADFQPHIGAWDYPVSPLLYRLYTEAMPRLLAWLRRRHRSG
jgi:lipid II:glycine glycyltransferase (peptidoglycan interpeptide bridge formation enzyme)